MFSAFGACATMGDMLKASHAENEKPDRPAQSAKPAAASMPRVWTPLFVCVVMVTLLMFIAAQGLNAGGSVYLARIGYSTVFAGISAAAFSISAAVMRIFVGQLLDARGRLGIAIIGGLVIIGATLACVPGLGETLFLVMRVLQGIGFAMVTTTASTMASDVLPIERMGEGLGYCGLGQAVSMSVGPGLALFLVQTDPAENLFIAMAILATGALLFCLGCTYEKHPEKLPDTSGYRLHMQKAVEAASKSAPDAASEGLSGAAQGDAPNVASERASSEGVQGEQRESILSRIFERRALCGALPTLAIAPLMGFIIYFMGLYSTEMGIASGGMYYTLSAVAMIIVRVSSRAFMDRVKPIRILAVGVTAGLVAMVLLLLMQSQQTSVDTTAMALFCTSGICYGLCVGLCSPLNQSVAVKNTPPERWGAANALVLLSIDVGIGIASFAWGLVRDAWGFTAVIIACMAFLVVAFLLALKLYPKSARPSI